jgi:hypothetical protein
VLVPKADTALEANPKALQAVRNARMALGTPYVYGGTQFGVGVDCSGLCFVAYRMAGAAIPRTTYTQWDAGWPSVKHGDEIPGDLVYSYANEGGVPGPGHVVMSLGDGNVIAADHTGSVVHVESIHVFDNVYVGSRRPLPAVGQGATPSSSGGTGDGGGSSALGSISSGFSFLTDWHTWYRFGIILGGVIAVVGAMYLLVHKTGVV